MDKNTIVKIAVLGGAAVILFGIVRALGTPAPVQAPVAETKVVEIVYGSVLSASTDLSLGSRIGEDSLRWVKWPEEALTASLITKEDQPEAIEDFHNSIVRSAIVEGEPINPAKLVRANGAGVMAALLNPGMRAVTTRISPDTAAGGFIQPGDRVDIILTRTFQIEEGQPKQGEIIQNDLVVAQTIFKNVRILAIDQVFSSSVEGGADIIGSTATFELNPIDVEVLQEAESAGALSLTLRGLTGSNVYTRSIANLNRSSALDSKKKPKEAALTLYRSGQAQRVAIEGQR